MSAAKTVRDKTELEPADLVAMFRAADEGIQSRGKAKPGDKTIVDALHPASEAFAAAIDAGAGLQAAAGAAIQAAEAGRDSVTPLRSKVGPGQLGGRRAHRRQSRSRLRHVCPGAQGVSWSVRVGPSISCSQTDLSPCALTTRSGGSATSAPGREAGLWRCRRRSCREAMQEWPRSTTAGGVTDPMSLRFAPRPSVTRRARRADWGPPWVETRRLIQVQTGRDRFPFRLPVGLDQLPPTLAGSFSTPSGSVGQRRNRLSTR